MKRPDITLVISLFILILITGCTPEPKPIDLKASVLPNRTSIVVGNEDTYDWTDVEIVLFPGLYRQKRNRIAAGAVETMDLNDFANYDGERFNPFARKLESVYIECKTPAGKGNWTGARRTR